MLRLVYPMPKSFSYLLSLTFFLDKFYKFFFTSANKDDAL